MRNLRFYLNIPVVCVLVVLFTLLSAKIFFAQSLYQDPTPGPPDYFSENSQLVLLYASEYGATRQTVSTIGRYALQPDDVPICLYLARERNYDPFDILGMNKRGLCWKEIFRTVGMPLNQVFEETSIMYTVNPPARFRHMVAEYNRWRGDGRPMDLSDDEIRDMVQLRYVVKKYGVTPDEVMRVRNAGKDWIQIILGGGQ